MQVAGPSNYLKYLVKSLPKNLSAKKVDKSTIMQFTLQGDTNRHQVPL